MKPPIDVNGDNLILPAFFQHTILYPFGEEPPYFIDENERLLIIYLDGVFV
jgi:hypothetical protein